MVADSIGDQYVLQERVRPLPDRVLVADEVVGLHYNWGVFLFDPVATGGSGFGGCIVRGTADPEAGVISMGNGALVGDCLIG